MKFRKNWTREQLNNTKMPFGPHAGKIFDEIPIKYLEELLDWNKLREPLKSKIDSYLADPLTQQAKEIEEKEG